MDDIDHEDPLTLSGEDFYKTINTQYGRSVEQILRFFDIDSYSILAGVRESQIFDVLEKSNDGNTSDDTTHLKKEVCCFVDDKVLLKIGTRRKIILLLQTADSLMKQAKKRRSSSSNLSHRFASQRSTFQSDINVNIDSDENNLDSEAFRTVIQQDLIKILLNLKKCIHGVTRDDITVADFRIGLDGGGESGKLTCWIECICRHRIKVYLRNKRFQLSNFIKHLRNENQGKDNTHPMAADQRANVSSDDSRKENEQSSTDKSSDENLDVMEDDDDGLSMVSNQRT